MRSLLFCFSYFLFIHLSQKKRENKNYALLLLKYLRKNIRVEKVSYEFQIVEKKNKLKSI
jgi:hypothetical protein